MWIYTSTTSLNLHCIDILIKRGSTQPIKEIIAWNPAEGEGGLPHCNL
jgi:hypothetical protein